MKNGGMAIVLPDSKIATHLAGPEASLVPPLQAGFKTAMVAYHLRGGTTTQQQLYDYQLTQLSLVHNIASTSHSLAAIASTHLTFERENMAVVPNHMRPWLSPTSASRGRFIDYEQTPSENIHDRYSKPISTGSESTAESAPPNLSVNIPARSPIVSPPPQSSLDLHLPIPMCHLSPHPVRCRCGVEGDGNLMTDGLNTVRCDTCLNWSHFACQRNGRANNLAITAVFTCDECTGRDLLPAYIYSENHSNNAHGANPRRSHRLRPLTQRLEPGKGVLIIHGDFWYPARLLQLEQERPERLWRARFWRGNKYNADPPDLNQLVPESDIVDELWQDRKRRRSIRLGLWNPASTCDEDEDLLADTASRPYTQEIDEALRLHVQTFKKLLAWEPGQDISLTCDDVPVLGYVQANQKHHIQSYRAGVVPFVGNLDIDSRAQIHNWIDNNVPTAWENRHLWIGRYTVAHAVTLLLATRMRPDPPQPAGDEKELMRRAWAIQTGPDPEQLSLQTKGSGGDSYPSEVKLRPVDVDAEGLRVLEHRMFEVSAAAEEAGYYQWGLDAGDHQNRWDPYSVMPSDWNLHDWSPDDDELLLQKGSKFISILTHSRPKAAKGHQDGQEAGLKRKITPRFRPLTSKRCKIEDK
ncbi:hypothetical protein C8Q80DRAFT_1246645 [Daedaleopsis nitida]|nr:hypothetical protein C8Q80DRAFT_1246645 [Daedaleopsis nitida]